MSEFDQAIGEKVREIRLQIGISANELARRLGVSSAQMSNLERGQRTWKVEFLQRVARELGTSIEEIQQGHVPSSKEIALSSLVSELEELSEDQINAISQVVKTLRAS